MRKPDYYLASGEYRNHWSVVRKCYVEKRLDGWINDQCILVHVDIPIPITMNLVLPDTDRIVLVPHFIEDQISPPSYYPLPVKVFIMRTFPVDGKFSMENVIQDAWCEIYETEASAKASVT
jgi:hypothetical protein